MLLDCHSHSYNKGAIVNRNSYDSIVTDFNFSYGFHPWEDKIENEKWINYECTLELPNCIAIGEIGLDKLKGPSLDIQIERLEKQLLINKKYKLPVIVHCVKSWNEIKRIANKYPEYKWVFHGFNKVGILEDVLRENWMISIGASILSNLKLQESIQLIPNNRLLLETDDSNLDIFQIYQKISEIKKISLPELEEIITNNFKSTFTKWVIG